MKTSFIRKQIRYTAAVLLLATGLLTGCSKEKVDYHPDTQQEGKKETMTDLESLKKANKWTESWNVQKSDGSDWKIAIDAVIRVPDRSRMSVIEVRHQEFDEAFKEQVCKALFGEEVYSYEIKDLPLKDLQAMLEESQKQLERAEGSLRDGNNDYWREQKEIYENEIAQIQESIKSAGNEYKPAADYTGNYYLGYSGDAVYILSFETGNYENIIKYFPQNYKDIAPQEMAGMEAVEWEEDAFPTVGTVNDCSITSDEAKERSDRLLETMGILSMDADETAVLCWTGMDNPDADNHTYGVDWIEGVDGYVFHYGFIADGTNVRSFGNELCYAELLGARGDDFLSMNTNAQIAVKEDAVVFASVTNPLYTTKITENVSLLSFETIQNIIRGKLTNDLERLKLANYDGEEPADRTYHFDRMDLIYLRLKDHSSENCYSFVPVWRLSRTYTDYNGLCYENAIFINAIDGTWIDYEELFS